MNSLEEEKCGVRWAELNKESVLQIEKCKKDIPLMKEKITTLSSEVALCRRRHEPVDSNTNCSHQLTKTFADRRPSLTLVVVDMPKVDPLGETTASLILNQEAAAGGTSSASIIRQGATAFARTWQSGASGPREEVDEQLQVAHEGAAGAPQKMTDELDLMSQKLRRELGGKPAASSGAAGLRIHAPASTGTGFTLAGAAEDETEPQDTSSSTPEDENTARLQRMEGSEHLGSLLENVAAGPGSSQGNASTKNKRSKQIIDTYRKNFPKEFSEKSKKTIQRLEGLIRNSEQVFQNSMDEIHDALADTGFGSSANKAGTVAGHGEDVHGQQRVADMRVLISMMDQHDGGGGEEHRGGAGEGAERNENSQSFSTTAEEEQELKTRQVQLSLPHHRKDPAKNWSPIDRMLFIKKKATRNGGNGGSYNRLQPLPPEMEITAAATFTNTYSGPGLLHQINGGNQQQQNQQPRTWRSVGVQTVNNQSKEEQKRWQLEELLSEQARSITSLEQAREKEVHLLEEELREQREKFEKKGVEYEEQAAIQQNTIDAVKQMLQQVVREKEQERGKFEREQAEEKERHSTELRYRILQHEEVVRKIALERDKMIGLKQQAEEERDRVMVSLETEQALLLARVETLQQQMEEKKKRGGAGGASSGNMITSSTTSTTSNTASESKIPAAVQDKLRMINERQQQGQEKLVFAAFSQPMTNMQANERGGQSADQAPGLVIACAGTTTSPKKNRGGGGGGTVNPAERGAPLLEMSRGTRGLPKERAGRGGEQSKSSAAGGGGNPFNKVGQHFYNDGKTDEAMKKAASATSGMLEVNTNAAPAAAAEEAAAGRSNKTGASKAPSGDIEVHTAEDELTASSPAKTEFAAGGPHNYSNKQPPAPVAEAVQKQARGEKFRPDATTSSQMGMGGASVSSYTKFGGGVDSALRQKGGVSCSDDLLKEFSAPNPAANLEAMLTSEMKTLPKPPVRGGRSTRGKA
eukprot:g8157.t1